MFWIEASTLEMVWFATSVTVMRSPALAYAGLVLLVFMIKELSIAGVESETVTMRFMLELRISCRISKSGINECVCADCKSIYHIAAVYDLRVLI